jgi:cellulose synthase/poly-beta-1,6-N-acetylglucosamine synthase-like glycosyltransferase
MTSTTLEVWQPPELRLPRPTMFDSARRVTRNAVVDVAVRLGKIYRGEPQVKTGRILVLIPAHDEEDTIGATVAAMWRQTRRPDKVIVIADNCTDDTASAARAHGATVMETVGNRDKKTGALNQAWEKFHNGYEFIVGIDADTTPDRDCLAQLEAELRANRSVGGVMARYTFEQADGGTLTRMQRLEFSSWTDDLLAKRRNTYVLGGQCSMFRADALVKVSARRFGVPWDTGTLVEDMQLTGDLRSMGYKTVVHPEARAYAGAMPSLKALWAQRRKWDEGMVRLLVSQPVNTWTRSLWKQQLSLLGNGFSRLLFAIMLTAALVAHKYVWAWWWALPPVLAVILNVRQAWRVPNRSVKDVILAALLVPVELYLVFRVACAAISWATVLSGNRRDGWAAQKRAEAGGGIGFAPKAIAFVLLVSAAVYGLVCAWLRLPSQWQNSTLITGWYVLAVITVIQILLMMKRILRPARGMRP